MLIVLVASFVFLVSRPMYVDSTSDKHSDSEQPVAKLLRTYLEPLLHVSFANVFYNFNNS